MYMLMSSYEIALISYCCSTSHMTAPVSFVRCNSNCISDSLEDVAPNNLTSWKNKSNKLQKELFLA